MQVGAFVWLDLAAAAVLVLWVAVRHPEFRPKSVFGALFAFGVSQLIAQLGVLLVPPIVRLPDGDRLVLVVVVLPVLFAMVLTSLWLLRAVVDACGGPRGGHRARWSSRDARI